MVPGPLEELPKTGGWMKCSDPDDMAPAFLRKRMEHDANVVLTAELTSVDPMPRPPLLRVRADG